MKFDIDSNLKNIPSSRNEDHINRRVAPIAISTSEDVYHPERVHLFYLPFSGRVWPRYSVGLICILYNLYMGHPRPLS